MTPIWLQRLPNQLTIFRMAMVPLLLLIYPWDIRVLNLLCAFLFIVASITDYFDGYIARKYSAQSKLGKLMDPIADKLLSTAGLLILVHSHHVPVILAGILLCRDVAINGLRLMASESRLTIEVSQIAKYKTFFQSTAICLLLIHEPIFSWPIHEAGMIALWIAIGFSVFSAYQYLRLYWEQVPLKENAN